MRWDLLLKASLAAGLVIALALVQCRGNMGQELHGSAGGNEGPAVLEQVPDDVVGERTRAGCDPDGGINCVNSWFICYTIDQNNKVCISEEPVQPDGGGEWDCWTSGNRIICEGDQMPPANDEEWDCDEGADGEVVCEGDFRSYYPGTDDSGESNCYLDAEFVVCEFGDLWDDGPPGNDNPDNPDDDGDSGGDDDDDCVCAPGAQRYCDTPNYCSWGIQYCDDDGLGWGECVETNPLEGCSGEVMQHGGYYYSSESQRCCMQRGECCQDFWDFDRDGDNQESIGDGCIEPVCV